MCAPYAEARPEGGARAEKEIGEKAQKIIRYQIVSTYFIHGAFKVLFFRPEDLSSAVFWFDNVYLRTTTEHPEDLFTLHVMRTKKKVANLRGLRVTNKKKAKVGNCESSRENKGKGR
jgi:hypothetical protein